MFADPPEITLRPKNQQVKAGGIAAFYCAARGDPQPVIQWRKNGKRLSGKLEYIIEWLQFTFIKHQCSDITKPRWFCTFYACT